MTNFKIEIEETRTYWERMKKALLWRFFFCVGLLLEFPCIDIIQHSPPEIPVFLIVMIGLLFIMFVFYCDSMCAYYIKVLEINENNVHMIYTKRDKRIELNNSLDEFKFKVTLGVFQNLRIRITYRNYYVISQYNKWNWKKDGAFNKTGDFLIKNNLQTKGFWN